MLMLVSVAISAVVTSTCLHASILHDSEVLRKDHPGLERYKMAAQQNASKWYNAHVKLLPTASGLVQLYDATTKSFAEHPESDEDQPIVDLYGPFAYFLSTVNVDRLEPTFRITPLARVLPTEGASCDVVIVRPFEGGVKIDTEEERTAFVPKLWAVMTGAYQNGTHTDLRFKSDGTVAPDGEGDFVVEYVRCGGWEWIPVSDDCTGRSRTERPSHRMTSMRVPISCARMGPYTRSHRVVARYARQLHPQETLVSEYIPDNLF